MGKGMKHQQLALVGLVVFITACIPELDRAESDAGVTTPDIPESQYDSSSSGSDGPLFPSDVSITDADGQPEAGTESDALISEDCGPDPDTTITPDQLQTDTFAGKWYQANGKSCPDFCKSLGMTNIPGPEGAHCMSGEARSASGIAQGIKFTYGCWGGCTGSSSYKATSHGKYCYMPGQKQDNDSTDITVGCFCG
jgi:hypothetical protein